MSCRRRANEYADAIIKHNLSIRECARLFGVSKTTVHTYISKYTTGFIRKYRLRSQLDQNCVDFHLKGGEATKRMYKAKRLKAKRYTLEG